MFNSALPSRFLAIAVTVASSVVPLQNAQAQSLFGESKINPNNMLAVAVPLSNGSYNLLVIEQIEGKQQCWSTAGSAPTVVTPLLLNFDFTGHCRRSTDSNGYSMRINGEDLGLQYSLRISNTENEALLVAKSGDRSKPDILIGRANGMADGFLKLNLLPGWEMTRRTYQNKPLGHFYFSSDGSKVVTLGDTTTPPVVTQPPTTNPPTTTPPTTTPPTTTPPVVVVPTEGSAARFKDIGSDIYRAEIEKAVNVGFIAGFSDNTFRPTDSLTREQLVSMAIESLKLIPNSNIQVPTRVTSSPYPDVASDRWSAGKIAWAQANNIVSGYKDGTFKPNQQVTRAELMAILRRTAQYAQELQGQGTELQQRNQAFTFVDLNGHWASSVTIQMSQYCQAASPYQESGDRFLPDTPAQRNYAAAATLRTIQCAVRPN